MNFRYLLLFAALGLSACDGSDSSSPRTDEGTFVPPPVAIVDTGGTGGGTKIIEPEPDPQQTVRLKADALKAQGKIDDASLILRTAGMDEEAYKLYAPEDYVLRDLAKYDDNDTASLDPKEVDERPAVKHHSMVLNGKTIWFTASTGHLIAYAQKGKKDAQASIFYTAYTRDDLPNEKRPVTFIFNGGPGSSAIWLHMGAWGPKRIETNSPAVAPDAAEKQPEDMPLVDNAESLLDESDLVFVDPPGTGYSEAIAPHVNKEFWGVQADTDVLFQFIKHYVNLHKRQASPKYLYGESYGGGIRVPILSRLMAQAGTSAYDPEPSGKKIIALSGSIFHSPVFNMSSMCNVQPDQACWTLFPTYAMTKEAYASPPSGNFKDLASYLDGLRTFTSEKHYPASDSFGRILRAPDGPSFDAAKKDWDSYATSKEGEAYFSSAEKYTNVAVAEWRRLPTMPFTTLPSRFFTRPEFRGGFMESFKPGYRLNVYDSRMHVKGGEEWGFNTYKPYNFNYYEHKAFHNVFTRYMPDYLNYINGSYYQHLNTERQINQKWRWKNGEDSAATETLSDIYVGIQADPSVKYMAVHGYYDTVTAFFTTEWNLAMAELKDRIPVKNYHGGHMIYYSKEARIALKKDVADFYRAPPVAVVEPQLNAGNPPIATTTRRAAVVPALPLN